MMSPLGRTLFKFLFFFEIGVFVWTYLFGLQGVQTVFMMRHENAKLAVAIQSIKHEIVQIQRSIDRLQTNSFYTEKYAREQLQMARPDDTVYFLL